jgi:8-oxo-dGTP pyrophosphatase MutT (NUDIX family)
VAVRSWEIVSSSYIVKDDWLTLRADECRTLESVIVAPYYVLEYPAWVNVLALTSDNEAIVIRQYRHGIRDTILELPGGAVDDRDSSAGEAVRRELREETGYVVEELAEIGSISASPHNHTNQIHCFLGKNARRISEPNLELSEQIEVEIMPLSVLLGAAYRGKFKHPHHLATIFFATAAPSIFGK